MNKATFFIGIIISVIIVSGIRLAMSQDDSAPQSPQSSEQADTDNEKTKEFTMTGQYDCLEKTGDGPQTMECAMGLTLDDGTQYGLGSDDPALLAGVSTGTRIEVTGTLQESSNTTYETAGTIIVNSFKQL